MRALLHDVVYILVAVLNGTTGSDFVFAGLVDESSDTDGADGSGGGCDDVAVVTFFFDIEFL